MTHGVRTDLRCSIVVASYNRSALLAETLASLQLELQHCGALQTTEIVLIDNNSPDQTSAVMAEWAVKFAHSKHIIERQQGLSHARNAGIQIASGQIIVFLDDDVELTTGWLTELVKPFDDPAIGVVGGRVLAFGSATLPEWLPRQYGYLVSVFDPFDNAREIDKVMGANFAVRAGLFDRIGRFDPKLGRKGSKLLGGEEVELFRRVQACGMKVWYTPHSVLYHKIQSKLNREYVIDYAYWLGVSEAHLELNGGRFFKYVIKFCRSVMRPWLIAPLAKWNATAEVDLVACEIKSRYALGYINMRREIASM